MQSTWKGQLVFYRIEWPIFVIKLCFFWQLYYIMYMIWSKYFKKLLKFGSKSFNLGIGKRITKIFQYQSGTNSTYKPNPFDFSRKSITEFPTSLSKSMANVALFLKVLKFSPSCVIMSSVFGNTLSSIPK